MRDFDLRFSPSDEELIVLLRKELLEQDAELKKFAWMLAEIARPEQLLYASVRYDQLLRRGKT